MKFIFFFYSIKIYVCIYSPEYYFCFIVCLIIRLLIFLNDLLTVFVNEVNKMFHIFRINVRINSVTQIGNVVFAAELLQHIFG